MGKKAVIDIGDIVCVPLEDGMYGYAHYLGAMVFGFLNYRDDGSSSAFSMPKPGEYIFKVWLDDQAVVDAGWDIVASVSPHGEDLQPVPFFKQDILSNKLSITYDGSEEIPATYEECRNLERAAVWQPIHIQSRLLDYFEGRPNKFVTPIKMPTD